MARDTRIMTFSVGLRALLGLVFSLAAILSMDASAAYADCIDSKPLDAVKDCFSPSIKPETAATNNSVHQQGILSVAPNDGISVLRNPPGALVTPAPQGAGFYVNKHPGSGEHLPESLPLIVLFGVLLAVILVRAKSFNNK
jgi:hypothetical protein